MLGTRWKKSRFEDILWQRQVRGSGRLQGEWRNIKRGEIKNKYRNIKNGKTRRNNKLRRESEKLQINHWLSHAVKPSCHPTFMIWQPHTLCTSYLSFALALFLIRAPTLDCTAGWLTDSRWYDPILYRSIGSNPSEVAATLLTTESGNGRSPVSSERIASSIWDARSWSVNCKASGSRKRRDIWRWCLVKLALVKLMEGSLGPSITSRVGSGGGAGGKDEDVLGRIDASDKEGRSRSLWDRVSSDCPSSLNYHQQQDLST
jgi:hypothetical protein